MIADIYYTICRKREREREIKKGGVWVNVWSTSGLDWKNRNILMNSTEVTVTTPAPSSSAIVITLALVLALVAVCSSTFFCSM